MEKVIAPVVVRSRGGQWEKAVGILRELRGTAPDRRGERSGRGGGSVGGDGGGGLDRVRMHLGQSSSLAFNAALVACAKVRKGWALDGFAILRALTR